MSDLAAHEVAEADQCLRCGYDLRGMENAHPCPECGLLAERSRRISDELYDTRPKWLGKLSLGVWVMLVALVTVVAWPLAVTDGGAGLHYALLGVKYFQLMWLEFRVWAGISAAALMFWFGAMLLTATEGYPPADQADARFRRLVRLAAAAPLAALLLLHAQQILDIWNNARWSERLQWRPLELAAVALASAGCWPLPMLIFLRLRSLAQRARSAHLAEHCAIVGAGMSISLVYASVALVVLYQGDHWFGQHWMARSNLAMSLLLALSTLAGLFALWSLYLLVRFARAFGQARGEMMRRWRASDRSS